MSVLKINFAIDPEKLRDVIKEAKQLDQNPQVFKQLSQVAAARAQIKAADDAVKAIENEAKALINERAKQTDKNWTVIVGPGYKINRSQTGAVYLIEDEAKAAEFIKKQDPAADTDKVKEYHETESKLPPGVVENPERGDKISIKVDA